MTDRLDDELLARYLAGQAGAAERARVDAWAGADPAHRRELDQLRSAWATGRPAAGDWDVDAAWARLNAALDPAVEPFQPDRRAWIRYAAAAAVLIVAAGILARPKAPVSVYETGVGEQKEIQLADGSRIVLAPASRLEVRPGFGQPAREVALRGRAWFEVAHDEARPFRVVCEDIVIEDLGTEFEVIAPRGDTPLQVAVVSGAVAVRTPDASPAIQLGPRDVARVPVSGRPSVRHEAPVETMAAWRAGSLTFDEATVAEILDELSRWYGVTFEMGDPAVALRPFTATLPTADLAETLQILSTGLDLAVARQADVVTLSPRTRR